MRIRTASRAGLTALALLASGISRAEDPAPDVWPAMKREWARDHLDLARDMLKRGCPGFADTQAGLAGRLDAQAPGLADYTRLRQSLTPPSKGWTEGDWKAYGAKRQALHKRHAKAAAALPAPSDPNEAADLASWTLQMDPDEPTVRLRRGERLVKGLGWLPEDMAQPLLKGLVRCGDAWRKPDPKQHVGWEQAYEIPTEHFRLRTTWPHAEALAAAADLERLHGLWAEMLEGIVPLTGRPPLPPVWLLKRKADYQACVTRLCPEAAQNPQFDSRLGFADPRGAFFHPEGAKTPIRSLMLHEVTHLIHMSLKPLTNGPQRGFWCVEGTAVLMEGLGAAKHLDWNAALGLPAAHPRREVLARVDMSQPILDLDREGFYREDARTLLGYEQAWVLSHFMLCAGGGVHRRAFLEYLVAVLPGDAGAGVFETHFPEWRPEAVGALAGAHLKTLR